MRREATTYDAQLQLGKERNVARVAQALHGLVLETGATFSWHRQVGPPLEVRGFAVGPELHGSLLEGGVGGGACQVANLVYWLGLHAGFEVIERHRHALDLFRDESRTAPFGCGATVFFPMKDLKLLNLGAPARLSLRLEADALHGAIERHTVQPYRCELVERNHRFVRRGDSVWRRNTLLRRWSYDDGSRRDEWLADHSACVAYPVDDQLISSGE